MKFKTLEDIKQHEFNGCHFSDREVFDAIDVFVQDETNALEDRAEALRVMFEDGMGLDPDDMTDQEMIDEYNKALQER